MNGFERVQRRSAVQFIHLPEPAAQSQLLTFCHVLSCIQGALSGKYLGGKADPNWRLEIWKSRYQRFRNDRALQATEEYARVSRARLLAWRAAAMN